MGRIATQAAILLRGKQKADFAPHKDEGDFVTIQNAGKLRFTGRKLEQKRFYSHSGYPGGLSSISLQEAVQTRLEETVRKTVWGMLPVNKLRALQIKRLKVQR